MAWRLKLLLIIGLVLLTAQGLFATAKTDEQIEKWFQSDGPEKPVKKINLGKLVFLDRVQYSDVMHSENKITITNASLVSGWVSLDQCYHNLDAFPKVEVVYKYRKMRKLKIKSFQKISSAKVTGQTIALSQVKKGASLCIKAQVLALEKNPQGYHMRNGPYRRKFLDGYFPMRVSLKVNFPDKLQIKKMTPALPHNPAVISKGTLKLDATFEGVLMTDIQFKIK